MASDGSSFEKDFGYLIPFLDRVAAAISQLPDAAAREEGARLISGEKEKWQRLRQLLAGAQGLNRAAPPASPTPQQVQPAGAGSGCAILRRGRTRRRSSWVKSNSDPAAA